VLDPGQSDRRRPMGLEAEHGPTPALDRAVILFDDVVEVRAPAHEDVLPAMILSTKPTLA